MASAAIACGGGPRDFDYILENWTWDRLHLFLEGVGEHHGQVEETRRRRTTSDGRPAKSTNLMGFLMSANSAFPVKKMSRADLEEKVLWR